MKANYKDYEKGWILAQLEEIRKHKQQPAADPKAKPPSLTPTRELMAHWSLRAYK